jgi:glycosyltransferase involved in cell wall biosynthesis
MWPSQNLAQIFSSGDSSEEKFCGYSYKLGVQERHWGNLFFKIKNSSLGKSSQPVIMGMKKEELPKQGYVEIVRSKLGNFFLNSGIWELLFFPILSQPLLKWVDEFKPEIIYCQGYSLSFAWLPLMLKKKFDLPLVFQTTDDWPSYLYKNSFLSAILRPIVCKAVQELVTLSTKRFTIGDLMSSEYSIRYGASFETIMIGDSIDRFRQAIPRRVAKEGTISIIYSGNLQLGRWNSLIDLCKAAQLLNSEGLDIQISAFVSTIPSEAINILQTLNNLQILPPPSHDLVPSYLKGADILFLPEPFDKKKSELIRLSISTKVPLYTMSERPIIVYAPPIAGVTEYAKREGWAYIVDQPNIILLSEAIRNIVKSEDFTKKLIENCTQVALKNHDEKKIRRTFQNALLMVSKSIRDVK